MQPRRERRGGSCIFCSNSRAVSSSGLRPVFQRGSSRAGLGGGYDGSQSARIDGPGEGRRRFSPQSTRLVRLISGRCGLQLQTRMVPSDLDQSGSVVSADDWHARVASVGGQKGKDGQKEVKMLKGSPGHAGTLVARAATGDVDWRRGSDSEGRGSPGPWR